jgi:phage antirepressor YoqD-like protein
MLDIDQLAKVYGISNTNHMNRFLRHLKLQYLVGDQWVPTEKASGMFERYERNVRNIPKYGYKWNISKVKPILDDLFSKYSSIDACINDLCIYCYS